MPSACPSRSLGWTLAAAFAAGIASVSATSFHVPGINYNIRLGPDWDVKCKNAATIANDMKIIANVSDAVRLFSLTDCGQAELVVPAAIQANLTVSLGLWVSNDSTVIGNETAKLENLLKSHLDWFTGGHIADIHVGSEAIYRKDVTVEENIALLDNTRKLMAKYGASQVPLTIAEIGDTYLAHPELVGAVDVVQANGFPFWEKVKVNQAPVYFSTRMKPLLELAGSKSKRVEIGETGWATGGTNVNASEASGENAARYFSNFLALASKNSWKFYYFEAFDAEWKAQVSAAAKDTVEAHFGIFHADGTLKSEFAEVESGSNSSGNTGNSNTNSNSNGNGNGNSNGNSNGNTNGNTNGNGNNSAPRTTESAAYVPSESTTAATVNNNGSTAPAGSGAATTTTTTTTSSTGASTPTSTSDPRHMCHSAK